MRYQTNFPLGNETTRRINRLLDKYQKDCPIVGMAKTVGILKTGWMVMDVSPVEIGQFPMVEVKQVPGPAGGYEVVDFEVFLAKLESALYDEQEAGWKKRRQELEMAGGKPRELNVGRLRASLGSKPSLSEVWHENPFRPADPMPDLTVHRTFTQDEIKSYNRFGGGIGPIVPSGSLPKSFTTWRLLFNKPIGDKAKDGALKAEMDELRKNGEEWLQSINERKEEILGAFIAKYGCGPDEVELVEQRGEKEWKWWVRKKRVMRVYDKLGVITAIAKKASCTLFVQDLGMGIKIGIKGYCSLGVPRLYHDHKLDICLPEEINDEGTFGDIGKYIYHVPREVFRELLEGREQDASTIMSRVLVSDIYLMKP